MIEDLLAKIRTLQRSGHACSDAPCTICEVIRAFNRVSKSERKQALLGTCTSKYGDCAHFEDSDCKNWKPKARF